MMYWLKKNWKLVLNLITLLLLALVIYVVRHDVVLAVKELENVNLWILSLIIPLQFLVYYLYAILYHQILVILGREVPSKDLFKVSMEINFVNHVFPSGGVSGFSYFAARLKQYGVTTAEATLTQTMRFVLAFSSYIVLLFVGLLFLSLTGRASNLMILITCSIAFVTVFGIGVVLYVIGSKKRIENFIAWLAGIFNKMARLFTKKQEAILLDKVKNTAIELNGNYIKLREKLPALRRPLLYACVVNIAEIALVYVVYAAYGRWVNVGAIIIAFAIANTAGLVAALPGGIGVYEGLMTLVLISAGIPAGLSISATIMYRVIVLVLSLATGYYFYHHGLNSIARFREQKAEMGSSAEKT